MSQDQLDAVRRRKSYRLFVLSWRLAFLAAGLGALTQILWSSHLISQTAMVVVIVPLILVFCVSVFTTIVTGAIQAAYFSVHPLGRGPIQRQVRFGRMFLMDLVTVPWSLNPGCSGLPEPEHAQRRDP
ncbi:hypothetical protein V6U77_23930 [Micromonospora sp. CPCC 205546]|uniref:hypothetical protein n=1 Tax=Micromonospora sp. CPCC 205546 TaxID=3122397 RepID=UPI002FF3DE95